MLAGCEQDFVLCFGRQDARVDEAAKQPNPRVAFDEMKASSGERVTSLNKDRRSEPSPICAPEIAHFPPLVDATLRALGKFAWSRRDTFKPASERI